MNHHVINLTSNFSVLYSTIYPSSDGDVIEVFIKKHEYPNATYFDYKVSLPHPEEAVPEGVEDPYVWRYTFHPPDNITALNDTYVLGVRLVGKKSFVLKTML